MKVLISIIAALAALFFIATPAMAVVTITAAGDIAPAGAPGASADTAKEIIRLAPTTKLTLGDNQYDSGAYSQYLTSYDKSWGVFKTSTHPVPGNHEWETANAAGYKQYFGSIATPQGNTFYSYNIGKWHMLALDSELSMSPGSAEYNWLQHDLANDGHACELAYWHKPRFSIGPHGDDGSVAPLWSLLYADNATVILNGHDHDYQRYAPVNPSGAKASNGIREFVVGTGGASHYSFVSSDSNLQAKDDTHFGVLYMHLRRAAYKWEFITTSGTVVDNGHTAC